MYTILLKILSAGKNVHFIVEKNIKWAKMYILLLKTLKNTKIYIGKNDEVL